MHCPLGLMSVLVLVGAVAHCAESPEFATESLRGKVQWTADALQARFGIESDPDAAHNSVSLVTPKGEVYPIVKDVRGRGFFQDAQLRDREMELLVRRYKGSPFIQIIRIYTIKDGHKYALDYWCDICAIIMFELKECECCQGPIRLREQLVPEPAKK